jgi:serine O-acetyltransferase
MATLKLDVKKCGPGLFIQHGVGTFVAAEEIGENCWINQLVTVGYVNGTDGRPTIGDNVTISVGSRILGGVKIGDNVVVGPNSVVLSDIPPNTTVIGVPARSVWTKSK